MSDVAAARPATPSTDFGDEPDWQRLHPATLALEPDTRDDVATIVAQRVDLDRFASSWVRFLIPFRMRRGA